MHSYTYHHRVRYRECDPMGVVYHTHYLDYFEAARTEALRDLGLAYKDLEAQGIFMPVIDLGVQYHQPARYDDELAVTAFFEAMPRVRVPVRYEVRRVGEEALLVTGHVTLCFFDAERGRPTTLPAPLRDVFAPAFAS